MTVLGSGGIVNLIEYLAVARIDCRWQLQVMANHSPGSHCRIRGLRRKGPDLISASQLLAQTSKKLQPTLLPQAKREPAAAELASMRSGNGAVDLKRDCDLATTCNEGRALSKSDLVTLSAPPDKAISATAVLSAFDGLTAYYAAFA